MTFNHRWLLAGFGAALLSGCDYSGDWLFNGPIDGLPPVYQITSPDGGPIVPADIDTIEDIQANTIYGEVAASQNTQVGGMTAEFIGTGDSVCVWVDPEVAYWTQSVAEGGSIIGEKFEYPDNPWDDGDLDLRVGLSVYYTGSPSRIGDFNVTYEDSLGNPVDIELQDCPNEEASSPFAEFVDAGRGSAERCTIQRTEPGVSYTIALTSWAVPLDDDRLGYGLLVANGPCNGPGGVEGAAGRSNQATEENQLDAECVILGEAIRPLVLENDEEDYRPYYGFAELEAAGANYPQVFDFELLYCSDATDEVNGPMRDYCRPEARQVAEEGRACLWDGFEEDETNPLEKVKCFCGDPNDTPLNGPG